MSPIYVTAIGVAAPGLEDWPSTQSVLGGEAVYEPTDLSKHTSELLPANERRRAAPAVRLALRVAEEATANMDRSPLASVFTSSDSDIGILNRIGIALAESARIVSPTDFHNSVHNAAAGYWSIGAGARGPSSSVGAYDASFAAGLIEAAGYLHVDGLDTLLVAYDIPPPELLRDTRGNRAEFAAALVLSPHATSAIARLDIELGSMQPETTLTDPRLEALRSSNPAARCLPLLRALQRGGDIHLPAADGKTLKVSVTAL